MAPSKTRIRSLHLMSAALYGAILCIACWIAGGNDGNSQFSPTPVQAVILPLVGISMIFLSEHLGKNWLAGLARITFTAAGLISILSWFVYPYFQGENLSINAFSDFRIWSYFIIAIAAGKAVSELSYLRPAGTTAKAPVNPPLSSLLFYSLALGILILSTLAFGNTIQSLPISTSLIFDRLTDTWVHLALTLLFLFVLSILTVSKLSLRHEQKALSGLISLTVLNPEITTHDISLIPDTRIARAYRTELLRPETSGYQVQRHGLLTDIGLRRFVRAMISFLPMLGFLGTVLGIMTALGSLNLQFPTELSSVVPDDQASVANGLRDSLSGIALAFETTLLGLLGSLVASFILAWIEKSELETAESFSELIDQKSDVG